MLYTASRDDRRAHRGTVLDVGRPDSAFAPSPKLQADVDAGRCGWRQLERRYTAEMRTLYRADPQLWIDLVEQAALEDVTLVTGVPAPPEGEGLVRCHRRLLKEMLFATAKDVGVWVDPEIDALDRSLLEMRRIEVLRERGYPLTCPICRKPADTALAIKGRDGYGYCSEACLDADVARWKAQLQTPGSGRRP